MDSPRPPRPFLQNAPGHTIRPSKHGWAIRWAARSDLIKLGYPVKSLLVWKGITPNRADRRRISQRCTRYQANMLKWALTHKPPPKTLEHAWRPEEDAIVARFSVGEAFKALQGRRTRMAIRQRKYRLRYPEDFLNKGSPTNGVRWSAGELKVLKEQFPVAESIRDLKELLPGRTLRQIKGKARWIGLRRKYLGDAKLPSDRFFGLVDQIRIRAKEDGISLRKFDKELGTGHYFGSACRLRRTVNLHAVAKALDYFDATLTIDWRDR